MTGASSPRHRGKGAGNQLKRRSFPPPLHPPTLLGCRTACGTPLLYNIGAVASVGFISTLATARPVWHHYMVPNREIPKEFVARFPDFLPLGGKNGRLCGQGEARRGAALSNATPRYFYLALAEPRMAGWGSPKGGGAGNLPPRGRVSSAPTFTPFLRSPARRRGARRRGRPSPLSRSLPSGMRTRPRRIP